MKVERIDNELVVKIPLGGQPSRIQAILDYLRYEELTSASNVTKNEVDHLLSDVKKGRWERTKKRLGLSD